MHKLRNNRAPLLLTVVSACLGLFVAGAPSHVQAQGATLIRESQNVSVFVVLKLSFKHQSPENAPQVAAPFDSHLPIGAAPLRAVEQKAFAQQSPALANHQILVVTHLARASIEPEPAAKPEA